MPTPNMSRQFVLGGNEGRLDDNPAYGSGAVGNSLTTIYTTRGIIDLNEDRLPNAGDISVRPQDAIVEYDSFVCSSSGAAITGVVNGATLNAGDYLIFVSGDPTVATNWQGVSNTAIPASTTTAFNGATPHWVRVIGKDSPFFT